MQKVKLLRQEKLGFTSDIKYLKFSWNCLKKPGERSYIASTIF